MKKNDPTPGILPLGCAHFAEIVWCARKLGVSGNFNVKARKPIEHIFLKTLHAMQFCKISTKQAHPS